MIPGGLWFARWNGSSWDTEIVDPDTGTSQNSLAYGPTGDPAIACARTGYTGVRFTRWDGTQWLAETVADCQDCGVANSLAYDSSGTPFISHSGYVEHVRLTHWNGTEWATEPIEEHINAGGVTSLVFDPDGNLSLSYGDWPKRNLKFARKQP